MHRTITDICQSDWITDLLMYQRTGALDKYTSSYTVPPTSTSKSTAAPQTTHAKVEWLQPPIAGAFSTGFYVDLAWQPISSLLFDGCQQELLCSCKAGFAAGAVKVHVLLLGVLEQMCMWSGKDQNDHSMLQQLLVVRNQV